MFPRSVFVFVFVRPGIAVSVMLQACCVHLFVATEVVASVTVRNVFTVYRYAMGSVSVQLCSVRCTCGPGVQLCCVCVHCIVYCVREL